MSKQTIRLSPLCNKIYRHMKKTGGISARDAMMDYGITSASLARRICDLEAKGYVIGRQRKIHPTTGKEYTRYVLMNKGEVKQAA